jgi:hypothetical protein
VVARSGREESSGYDSSNDGSPVMRSKNLLLSRSDPDFRKNLIQNPNGAATAADGPQHGNKSRSREQRMKSISEANLLSGIILYNVYTLFTSGNEIHLADYVFKKIIII